MYHHHVTHVYICTVQLEVRERRPQSDYTCRPDLLPMHTTFKCLSLSLSLLVVVSEHAVAVT